MLKFEQPELDEVTSREWIVTNGLGGYASSSICGANTRRYHGLLVASFNPPTDRRVLVSKLEETILYKDLTIPISTNAYPGAIHPKGFEQIESFDHDPFPKIIFRKEKVAITKSIFMRHGFNTTIVEYANTGKTAYQLQVVPLLVYRDDHHLFHESAPWTFVTSEKNRVLEIIPAQDIQPFWIRFTKGEFHPFGDWYRNFQYAREQERGLHHSEDARSIGKIHIDLEPGEIVHFILTTDLKSIKGSPLGWKEKEIQRLAAVSENAISVFLADLMRSGDQFLVHRKSTNGSSVIAGYHWFTDWGRDTMISMRGLVIATGKKKMAESIFTTFLAYLDAGMIPNCFTDHGDKPEYNTMDGTLWLFVALYEYWLRFEDLKFIKKVFPRLTEILDAHRQGTRHHIHVTKEGLLYGGETGSQLTWMDAMVNGKVVTPRIGCPVEINALWYNALSIYEVFANQLGEDTAEVTKQIKKHKKVFRHYFINKKGYLNDVVVPGEEPDRSIRPNQMYAISLPFSPLTKKESKHVLETVEKHLYTPLGLRSLSPKDPDFQPMFSGDPWSRDHAYHQGTVWSFLWGEYALAYLKVHEHSAAACNHIKIQSGTLEEHFYEEAGIQCISEVFDGLEPNTGRGCIHQAWSVGMTLLALLEAEK